DKKFNFHGRICLEASLLWGILAIFLFSFIVPAVDWFLSLYPKRIGEAVYTVIFVMYLIDFTLSTIAAVDIAKQIERLENMLEELYTTLRNSRVYATSEELKQRVLSVRDQIVSMDYIRRYSKRLEVMQAVWLDRLSRLNLKDDDPGKSRSTKEITSRIRAISDSFEDYSRKAKLKLSESRVIRAYPKLKSRMRFRSDRDKGSES
nr:putative ABC transporter permease [Lachnospiraceae bacterium]